MQTTPDSTGIFSFCPVPAGTYDVVAVAVSGTNVAYGATITTCVQPGNALGNVPMIAVTDTRTASATITGQVTSVNTSSNGTAVDVLLSALESVSSTRFSIPVGAQSATLSATEQALTCSTPSCPPYTPNYTMTVPPANPTLGAFAISGTTYSAGYVYDIAHVICLKPRPTTR